MNNRSMSIDAHQHFWAYNPEEYDWISPEMQVLQRDFLPRDLATVLAASDCQGTIAVQARQTVAETRWLLELAAANPFIRGVVGWVPLASPDCARHLDEFLGNNRLKGVRHVVQAEQDEHFLERNDFNAGIGILHRHGLVYEILIVERQMEAARRFVDRHPNQTFVLDHLGKPNIREGLLDQWRLELRQLAERQNVFCKLSGLVTEADWQRWRPEELRPYIDTALEAFGPERLMFGSDWPVCLLACSHRTWRDTLTGLFTQLSSAEQEWIWGKTARCVYALDEPEPDSPSGGELVA